MEPAESIAACHAVALPYPGRGHINPMMNLCKLLVAKKPDLLITFILTEEWLGFIGSDPKPNNIQFATVPNVIPSELTRANNFPGFLEAVFTKLEAPVEELLDGLDLPVAAIIADTYVQWAVRVGRRRNIPVASLWTMSASVFTMFHHFELLRQNGHFPVDLSERGDEEVDYIPGIRKIRLVDLPSIFRGTGRQVLDESRRCIQLASEAQYFLSTAFYELESHVYDVLKTKLPAPIYSIGPTIPFFSLQQHNDIGDVGYLKWLDSQPKGSVLYVSLGSFLSVSRAQLDEIVAGVRDSGVRFLWVARGETSAIESVMCGGAGGTGLVVPWCEQLRVLCHPSVGGFWTHCGWNSTLEAVYSGVPMLTCPIFWDQIPNSKLIMQDWRIGWRVTREDQNQLITRAEIAQLVGRLMDDRSEEGMGMRERCRELKEACRRAMAKGGSSDQNLEAVIRDIFKA